MEGNKKEIGRKSQKKGKWWEWAFTKEMERLTGKKWKRTMASEKALQTLTGDIVCVDRSTIYWTDFSWQIKAREALNIFKALKKAQDDAEGKTAILIWQKANQPNLVFLNLKDFVKILFELEGYRKEFSKKKGLY